ncbi:MAG: 3' terminal RNA ribose 2'-O-methyltransferase Hen1 [Sulfobacillus benefaciens]|uniref:Small RNA 2'-O-methyltransferase n=1 Tax=Sulfobacillus benefaciens TaxID=453960 RepID=A0A2T2XHC2_9FIRM|nr:MAG: 3' terminal RNA ribose 2'-O-methyltransferase Hen1 [Sulfobacillus benefaciens]
MLLTISTTRSPATDLGYLLHKHPNKVQTFPLTFGQAHVFYPEATSARCTAALLLSVDPVGLVRGKAGSEGLVDQYVNDRPYTASSFLSVAIAQVFGTALAGHCKARPELVEQHLPLEATIAVVPSQDGTDLIRRLFEPLGYTVNATSYPLDEQFPEWGESPYYTVRLNATLPLHQLLNHLYVLIPVLDNDKHYYVGDDEVAKLLRHGEGWLEFHPERQLITTRYLKHHRGLATLAISRLVPENANDDPASPTSENQAPSLHEQRLLKVVEELKKHESRRVLDLGCGEGRLLRLLLKDPAFKEVIGFDISTAALTRAQERLHLDHLPSHLEGKVTLLHGSLTYRDRRLEGFDAAALVEVIEHLDLSRLPSFERAVFEFAHPKVVVVTTPNAEYNRLYPSLTEGAMRHRDHRFEWTRQQFTDWAHKVGSRFGYAVRIEGLGPEDEAVGSPSQMGVFTQYVS